MTETIAAYEGRIAKIEGPARSGKTEALIERCVHLIDGGQAPESILVSTATARGARSFRDRLRTALGTSRERLADKVFVLTPLEACVRVLSSPAAKAATGRVPRILTTAEYNFVLTDIKTDEFMPRQMRNTLFRFYRKLDANEPRSSWLKPETPEAGLFERLERTLRLRCGMLAQEAPAICINYLLSETGAAERGAFAYVMCDDFQNYSKSEQTALCLMANRQIIVAGNANEREELGTTHAHTEGFTTFNTVRPGVDLFTLEGAWGEPSIVAFADALYGKGDMDPALKANTAQELPALENGSAPRGVRCIKWATPEDEISGLVTYLQKLLEDDPQTHGSRTCIVAPNRYWAAMTEKALRRRGIPVSGAGTAPNITGDPSDTTRCRALVAYTRLNLLANPEDTVAWRSWCGFDRPNGLNEGWAALEDYAENENVTVLEALRELGHAGFGARNPFRRADQLAERWRSGRDFIAKNLKRRGFGLLKAIGAEGLPEFEAAAKMMAGNETPAELYGIVRQGLTDPVWASDPDTVHVTLYGSLCGTEHDNVFVIGAVDGFAPQRNAFLNDVPEDERERILNSDRRSFAATCARANRLLIISFFGKTRLEVADKAKMEIVRTKPEGIYRMAIARPSTYISEAGDACPSVTSGQELLAERGLA